MQRVIGFDAKRAFLNASGLGNYSRNTLNALNEFFPENVYALFTPTEKTALFDPHDRFRVILPPNHFLKLLKPLWRSFFLSGSLKKQGIELFHGLSNELPRGICKTGIPSVVTIHDLIFMRFPEFYKPVDRHIYFRKIKYACHAADHIIAISHQTKKDIETFFPVPPEKTGVIYQPVSPVFYEPVDVRSFFLKNTVPDHYILAVGTLEPRKNQLGLLKALKAANIDLPVVFVGSSTPYLLKMKKYIADNKLKNPVFFFSGLGEAELAGLYRHAALSVYVSFFEGFGLPVIEAMAAGCPVVTSSVSCLPETAGNAALLCDPGDEEAIGEKINALLKDETLRKLLIQRGHERAGMFHPETYAKKLSAVYAGVLKEKH